MRAGEQVSNASTCLPFWQALLISPAEFLFAWTDFVLNYSVRSKFGGSVCF